LLAALCCGAVAAAPGVAAPPDRLVLPGEYVTLVFRVDSDVDAEAEVRIETREGFAVVRRTERLATLAGRDVPLAVTVEVPAAAPAGLEEIVRVAVDVAGARLEAEVRLTVAELRELTLDAPDPFVLDDEPVVVTVRNAGNVAVDARLELRLNGASVDVVAERVPPLASVALAVRPVQAGIHELLLEGGGVPLRRPLRVIRVGPPEPERPALTGSVAIVAGSEAPRFGVEAVVSGALSDYVFLDALASDRVARSFVELRGIGDEAARGGAAGVAPRAWRARVGASGAAPFRLTLPYLVGGVAQTRAGAWEVALAAGDGDGALASYVAGRRSFDGLPGARGVVATGGGFDAGGARLAFRGELDGPSATLLGEAAYRDGALDAGLRLAGVDPLDGTRFRAAARLDGAFGSDPALRLEGSARAANLDAVFGRIVLDLAAPDASWRFGATIGLPSGLPGRLRQRLQVGSEDSHALLALDAVLGGGWQTQTSFGVVADADGGAVRASSSVLGLMGPSNAVQAYADVSRSLRDGSWSGGVAARGEVSMDAVALRAGGAWRPSEGTVELAVGADWTVADAELVLDVGVRSEAGSEPAFEARLEGRYPFVLPVPEAVVGLTGGRRLGTVEVVVTSGEGPLEEVLVRVGDYRLRTDGEGRAAALLPPGAYEVGVDGDALPTEYAPPLDAGRTVVFEARRSRTVALRVVRTGTVRGRLLLDSDGDGTSDVPSRGAPGRVILIERSGVVRDLDIASDGRFETRGVRPGSVELRIVGLPVGSSVVGPSERRLRVAPGPNEVDPFLVRPPASAARAFGGDAPRIAGIAPQEERVPPGSAPIVTVTVRGEADEVLLDAGGRQGAMRLVGDAWRARVVVPDDAVAGVLPITVTARNAAGARTRRGQIVIDPDVPLVRLDAFGPVEPGGVLEVRLSALSPVARAEVASEAAADPERAVPLVATERQDGVLVGELSGELVIARDAPDAVYRVTVTGALGDDSPFTAEARFRVLAP